MPRCKLCGTGLWAHSWEEMQVNWQDFQLDPKSLSKSSPDVDIGTQETTWGGKNSCQNTNRLRYAKSISLEVRQVS